MDNQDYRTWPNVLIINAEIKAVGLKIADATDALEIMGLKQKLAQLNARRYDQIQFNKEMFNTDKKAA